MVAVAEENGRCLSCCVGDGRDDIAIGTDVAIAGSGEYDDTKATAEESTRPDFFSIYGRAEGRREGENLRSVKLKRKARKRQQRVGNRDSRKSKSVFWGSGDRCACVCRPYHFLSPTGKRPPAVSGSYYSALAVPMANPPRRSVIVGSRATPGQAFSRLFTDVSKNDVASTLSGDVGIYEIL